MITKILHMGVAVKNMELSTELFTALFGISPSHVEEVPQQKSTIAYYPLGESSVELIESTSSDSTIEKFIKKRGEGIHHVCLEVDNIVDEIARLKGKNFQFVNEVPNDGGDGYIVAFLHPKSTNGVLVELAEKKK